MRNYVRLTDITEAGDRLRRQAAALKELRSGLDGAGEKIKHMSYMDKTKYAVEKAGYEMDENIRALTAMADALSEICEAYEKAEGRICDYYNLDAEVYPATEFGVSRITGLEKYQSWILF